MNVCHCDPGHEGIRCELTEGRLSFKRLYFPHVTFIDDADSITILFSKEPISDKVIEDIIESAILAISSDYKIIWRLKGDIRTNMTSCIQQGQRVLSWKEVTDILVEIKANITALYHAKDLSFTIFKKPIAYATPAQAQYAPGYVSFALTIVALLAVSTILWRKSVLKHKRSFDKAMTIGFLCHLFLWSLVLFVFAEEPTPILCRLRLLFPVLLVSFEIG
jgi:uncharacterized protein YheU (UPF0270 family)